MARAFVSIGSNIDPETNVEQALRLLGKEVRLRAVSTVYLTEPIGPPGPAYYNCVIEIETELAPRDLKFTALRRIEEQLGRVRTADKFAPRAIDLDILLYDDRVMTTDELTLPDPDIMRRPFLALALAELAPELVLPGSRVRIENAAAVLPRAGLKPLGDYTQHIRKDILSHDRTQ